MLSGTFISPAWLFLNTGKIPDSHWIISCVSMGFLDQIEVPHQCRKALLRHRMDKEGNIFVPSEMKKIRKIKTCSALVLLKAVCCTLLPFLWLLYILYNFFRYSIPCIGHTI